MSISVKSVKSTFYVSLCAIAVFAISGFFYKIDILIPLRQLVVFIGFISAVVLFVNSVVVIVLRGSVKRKLGIEAAKQLSVEFVLSIIFIVLEILAAVAFVLFMIFLYWALKATYG